jgi:hypothetical protein
MKRYRLGQDLGQDVEGLIPEPVTATTVQDVTAEEAAGFASLWQRFERLWPQVLQQRQEILEHRERWARLAREAARAGDIEGMRVYNQRVTQLDALEADRQQVESVVQRMREAWDAIRTYLRSAGQWLGISSLGGLGLPPIALAVGIPAAIAALAWVVNTILRIRADLDVDRQLLEAAERGVITPEQAARAIAERQREAAGGLLSIGAGGAWPSLLLVGLVLVGLWAVSRR